MIVIAGKATPEEQIQDIVSVIEKEGLQVHISRGEDRTIIGLIGKVEPKMQEHLRQMKGVENVVKISKSYKLASRDFHPEDTVISIKGVDIGGKNLLSWADHVRLNPLHRLMRLQGL